jgi:iron complex transport system ATP-binding protein
MIRVEQISKHYDDQIVLQEIHFQVEHGMCLGIIGPNGSGKSTLLQLISGVEPMTSGHIFIRNEPIGQYSRKELSQQLAVLQQDGLPPLGYTVREVLEMGRFPFQNWMGKDRMDASELIEGIAEQLHLCTLLDRKLDELSGGQRQRVALGKVMVQQPEILLLDEPTTYLDIRYQLQFMDYVRKWQRECGLTIIAVLHDLNLAAQYCDQLLVLHEGKQVAIGTPNDIIEQERVAQVFGTEPIIIKHPVNGAPQILLQPQEQGLE